MRATLEKPKRAPRIKPVPVLTDRDMLGDEDERKVLYDNLDKMRIEQVCQTAQRIGLKWEGIGKATLIDQIIAVEVDRTRIQEAAARKLRALVPEVPQVPADPDLVGRSLMLTPQQAAVLMAAMLPPDAVWTSYNNSCQTYGNQSIRYQQGNAVTYSHKGTDGHERRYRVKFPDLIPFQVEELP